MKDNFGSIVRDFLLFILATFIISLMPVPTIEVVALVGSLWFMYRIVTFLFVKVKV